MQTPKKLLLSCSLAISDFPNALPNTLGAPSLTVKTVSETLIELAMIRLLVARLGGRTS
jgi:hypothetical protein